MNVPPPTVVTGVAGFIGYHLATRLLRDGRRVVGLDNLNDYYSVRLKQARLAELEKIQGFSFRDIDVCQVAQLQETLATFGCETLVHLAAQAGVRHSLLAPLDYGRSNLQGFLSLLEAARRTGVKRIYYASSSSVYGGITETPFSTSQRTDYPVSLYAATKKANEVMAHAYSHLYGIRTTGLRFFTVYGPWGRPDMAYYMFTRSLLTGKPIELYDGGRIVRDFTYVGDVVEAVTRLLAVEDSSSWSASPTGAPYDVLNVGGQRPIEVRQLLAHLERLTDRTAIVVDRPLPPGDVRQTHADCASLASLIGYVPETPIEEGLARFVQWYTDYHQSYN